MTEDETVTIDLELENDLILDLALLAHKRDMKLNTLIVEILEKTIRLSDEEIEELRKEYNKNVEI